MLSALQSAVFNRALELRATRGPLTRVLPGDVLKKTDTGGLFVSTDPEVDQRRVDAGELIPTAPMPGGREIEPPPGTAAHALEDRGHRSRRGDARGLHARSAAICPARAGRFCSGSPTPRFPRSSPTIRTCARCASASRFPPVVTRRWSSLPSRVASDNLC